MRTFFLFLSLFFFVILSKSQTNVYHPFVHDGAEWNILGVLPNEQDTNLILILTYFSEGDTVIETKNYIKTRFIANEGISEFLREDVDLKHIYYKSIPLSIEDTLLYDFSVTEGESVSHTYSFSRFDSSFVYLVDSVEVGDNYRKRFHIIFYFQSEIDTTFYGSDTTFWVEGIGGEFGPSTYLLGLGYPDKIISLSGDGFKDLLCYSENDELQFTIPNIDATCDSLLITSVAEQNIELSIYPNPATNGSYLIIKTDRLMSNCKIFSINGKLIDYFNLNGYLNEYYINPNLYSEGMYIISLKADDGELFYNAPFLIID